MKPWVSTQSRASEWPHRGACDKTPPQALGRRLEPRGLGGRASRPTGLFVVLVVGAAFAWFFHAPPDSGCRGARSFRRMLDQHTGSAKRKVEPLPTSLSTETVPPCASTIPRTIARPKPVLGSPPVGRVLVR